jgi:transcriptional regulator with XRE-family HTH domain
MSNEVTKIFADRLQDLISDSGKTVKQLAKEIGVPSGSLSKYQNDCAEAGTTRLFKIAKYFNVSTDYLLGLTEVKSVDADLKVVHKITGLSQKAIEKIVETMLTNDMKGLNSLLESQYYFNLVSAISNIIDLPEYTGEDLFKFTSERAEYLQKFYEDRREKHNNNSDDNHDKFQNIAEADIFLSLEYSPREQIRNTAQRYFMLMIEEIGKDGEK